MESKNDKNIYRVVRLDDGSFKAMTEKDALDFESKKRVKRAFQNLRKQQEQRDKEMELRRRIANGEMKIEPADNEKDEKRDKRWNLGCFIIVFLFIAAGIPAATKGEGPIGSFVVAIIGLVIAYYVAKALSGRD